MASDLRLGIVVEATDKASGQLRGIGGSVAREAKGMSASLFEAGRAGDSARMKLAAVGAVATQTGMAMAAAGGIIVGALGMATKAAMEQEAVENRLRVVYGKGADELIAYAGELQKLTRFGDEATISAMAFGATFPTMKSHLKEATAAATNMAEAYGMDLKQAMLMLGRASTGQVGALRRVGINIDAAKAKAGGFEYVLKVIAEETQNAAFETDNASKRFAMFKNALGDVAEEVGSALLPVVSALTPALTSIAQVIGKIAGSPLGKFLTITTAGLGLFLVSAGTTLVVLGQMASALTAVASAASMFGGAAGLGSVIKGLVGVHGSVGLAAKGVSGLGTLLMATGPYIIAIAAIAALAYELYKLKQAYDESAKAARQAKKDFEAAGAAEREAAKKGYADSSIVSQQEREVANARITFRDRVTGAITGGGYTALDAAQQRVRSGQESAVYRTMQNRRSGGSTVNVYVGDKPLEEKMYEVQERSSRGAMATAGAY